MTKTEKQEKAMAMLHQAITGKQPEGGYVIALDKMIQVSWDNPDGITTVINFHQSDLFPFDYDYRTSPLQPGQDCSDNLTDA